MSNVRPMGIAAKVPHVRYSAAYPTDASAPQASGCLSEANPKGRKGPRESVSRKGLLYHEVPPLYSKRCDMSVVKNILCVSEGENSDRTQKWKIISIFDDEKDVSGFKTGCEVAMSLGKDLLCHLKHPQNPMGLHKVTFGPAYTYGAKRATAVVFFDGILGPNTTVPMKVESHCEWIDEKII